MTRTDAVLLALDLGIALDRLALAVLYGCAAYGAYWFVRRLMLAARHRRERHRVLYWHGR